MTFSKFLKQTFSFLWHKKLIVVLVVYSILSTIIAVDLKKQNSLILEGNKIIMKELSANNFFLDNARGLVCSFGIQSCAMSKISTGDGNYEDGTESKMNKVVNNNFSYSSSDYMNYSSFSSMTPASQEPRKVKFYGFIGGSEIDMDFNISNQYITGKYFSRVENKEYEISGMFSENRIDSSGYDSGIISLVEKDEGRATGKFDFSSETPEQYNQLRIPSQLFFSNMPNIKLLEFKTLSGSYTDANGKYYDTYLTTNESIIKNWTVESIKGKFVKQKSNYPGGGTPEYYFILGDDGTNYFTRDIAKFKDIEDGKTVQVKTKYRKYNQIQSYFEGGAPYECMGICPQGVSTKLGLFQVESVRVVE
jgi:hypothetical protein